VANTILSYAADNAVDFMVMGGSSIRACANSRSAAPREAFPRP
jgi:hypothetical protein